MFQVLPAAVRHFSDYGWLKTYWLFSFSDYYDPQNVQFGSLRVFNDDVVLPDEGFPMHPHREIEIVTIVLDGEISHEDSLGNKSVIRAHDVQRMSAGTGIMHSEFNRATAPVHFYQVWITPGQRRLNPSYDQKTLEPSAWKNRLATLASGADKGGILIHSDTTIYRSFLDENAKLSHSAHSGRGTFLYMMTGALKVAGHVLRTGDQLRTDDEGDLSILATAPSEFILIDVPL